MAADDSMRLGNLFSFGKEKTQISTNFLTFGHDFMKKVDVFGGDLFPPGKPRGDEDADASTRKEPTKQKQQAAGERSPGQSRKEAAAPALLGEALSDEEIRRQKNLAAIKLQARGKGMIERKIVQGKKAAGELPGQNRLLAQLKEIPTSTKSISGEDEMQETEGVDQDRLDPGREDTIGQSPDEFAKWFGERVNPAAALRARRRASRRVWRKFSTNHRLQVTQKYLNALHSANLLMQYDQEAFQQIIGTDDKAICNAGAMSFFSTPRKFLNFGPLGELPIHLCFLLGKPNLGIELLESVKSSDEYWKQCSSLIEKVGSENMPTLPEKKNTETLRKFIINIPYVSDILWWFKEIEKREEIQMREGKEPNCCDFYGCVPPALREGIKHDKTAGLFTGETSLHIAIANKNMKLVEYLLKNGADVDAQACGNFFHPKICCKFRDINRGCYYGPTPLCFAASLGDPAMLHSIIRSAKAKIKEALQEGWCLDCERLKAIPPTRWTSRQSKMPDWRNNSILKSIFSREKRPENEKDPRTLGHGWMKADRDEDSSSLKTLTNLRNKDQSKSFGFLDRLALQWYTMCQETNEEDWNLDYKGMQKTCTSKKVGDEKEMYFKKEFFKSNASPNTPLVPAISGELAHVEELEHAFLLAFVNTRDGYGNSALHLAVEHNNDAAIKFLLKKEEASADYGEFSGLGLPSLTLLNWYGLTPLTLSLRLAKTDRQQVVTYQKIRDYAYTRTVWRYGLHEMRIMSLYQIDTFRVHGKKLHNNPHYMSALEVVVDYEVPVLDDLPELAELIAHKWKRSGWRQHVKQSVLPYLSIVAALTASILMRFQDLDKLILLAINFPRWQQDGGNIIQEAGVNDELALSRLTCDLYLYVLGVPWLLYSSWFNSHFRGRCPDLSHGFENISFDDVISYIFFKNWISISCATIALLLVVSAAIRFSSQPRWLNISPETFQAGTWEYKALYAEMDMLAFACLFAWLNIFAQLLPFQWIGTLHIALVRMLSRDVLKWLLLLLIILAAFSLAGFILAYDFALDTYYDPEVVRLNDDNWRWRKAGGGSQTQRPGGENELTTDLPTLKWPDMINFFIWASLGEVSPGVELENARNHPVCFTLYVVYICVSTLVLMNLLISLMSNTFANDTAMGRQLWWYEFATAVLRYEAHMSDANQIRYRSGTFEKEHPDSKGFSVKDQGGLLTCTCGKQIKGSKNSNVEFFRVTLEHDKTPQDKTGEQIYERLDVLQACVTSLAKDMQLVLSNVKSISSSSRQDPDVDLQKRDGKLTLGSLGSE